MQGDTGGTDIGIITIIVGLFVGIIGSYILFIISAIKEREEICKANFDKRIDGTNKYIDSVKRCNEEVKSNLNDISAIVHELKGWKDSLE